MYEIEINGRWVKVSWYIARSWSGRVRLDGKGWYGPSALVGHGLPNPYREGDLPLQAGESNEDRRIALMAEAFEAGHEASQQARFEGMSREAAAREGDIAAANVLNVSPAEARRIFEAA